MAARVAAVGAVLPIGGAGVSGIGPAGAPDADLLALCAEFDEWAEELRAAEAAIGALPEDHTEEEHDVLWSAMEEVLDVWNEIHDEIVETPATTMAGFRAKAAVLRASLEMFPGGGAGAGIGESSDPHERLAWSLACDLAGAPS